jgi:RNA polymerase sigma-70 factor (ECF subfamily)
VDPDRLARLLYDRHGPALRRWAAGRFPDHQVAEEVVQETVTKAWRNHDQFDPGRGSERAWMFGIARNVAASRHRRDARHLRTVPTDDLAQPGVDDAELSRVSELALIVDAFASLSDDHRAVVVAAYWEGLSTREIAARLSVPDGTVKSRLHYALRILRTQLEERGMLR